MRPLLLALVSVAVVVAQTPAPQPPQPTFRTEANYVRVDAYPTKDGEAIADLTQEDFEVLESGVPQRIEQFERVVVAPAGPQETRIEPSSVAESRSMAQSSRARLFVVFLDTYHVDVGGSHNIRNPLVEALDRVVGRDDLIAVMTPEMAASDITFARKTTTIEGFLARYWAWGQRDRLVERDLEDQRYDACYPNNPDIVQEMIARRHEKMTMDALEDLARVLRGVREERKAILAISDGWLLYRPNPNLARPLDGRSPGTPQIGVDPRSGRLTAGDPRNQIGASAYDCDRDRLNLSNIDNDQQFRTMLDEANRANASFYPIDPRGLVVFDTPISQRPPVPLVVDAAMLRQRETTLRTLADATDGVANLNTNDLAASFRKIVADLSAYYLLGYYSSGKLDGRFHPITVRVKRPGVQVRARRGYLAATPGAATRLTAGSAPAVDAETAAVTAAIAPLASFVREVPLRLRAAAGWKPDGGAAVWVVGEVTGEDWKGGLEADAMLTSGGGGAALASGRATVAPGTRSFQIPLAPSTPMTTGEFVVRVRARSASAPGSTNEAVRFTLPASPDPSGAIVVRRGPSTGNKEAPTADLRFRRNEQLRVEVPTLASDAGVARLLDRAAKPLAVPVAAAIRVDADGTRWLTAQLALAALAPGDYAVELSAGGSKSLTPFRIIP
jgi:VWFA-related protein